MRRLPSLPGIGAALLITFTSCSSPNGDTAAFKILDEGLLQTNKTLQYQNSVIYAAIEEKLREPAVSAKVALWHAKAKQVSEYSTDLQRYIENQKEQLKQAAGVQRSNGIEMLHEHDESVVDDLFIQKGNGPALLEKIKHYKQALLQIDSSMNQQFKDRLTLTSTVYTETENDPDAFTTTFFKGKTPVAALAMLSRLQNAIALTENRLTTYCLENCSYPVFDFVRFAPIVGQSSTYVKGGEEMSIDAGVGAFIPNSSRPQVTIDGKLIPVNANGVARFTWKAPTTPGQYSIPARIEYTDQDGNRQTITKQVAYTVADTGSR
jgi:gliding motility-associated protein GldM